MNRWAIRLLTSAISAIGTMSAEAQSSRPVATFKIEEHFGVDHPDQIIDFDLATSVDPGKHKLVGSDGQEVLYQVLAGKRLAVRTDLAARTAKSWKLMAGKPAAPTGKQVVSVTTTADWHEITNGLIGVRVTLPAKTAIAEGTLRPLSDLFHYGPGWRILLPAPVQGVRLQDATWTAEGPNLLVVLATKLIKMDVTFLEQGPLKTVVQVLTEVEHPEYRYGESKLKEGNKGFHRCTITVAAGQPSILFEEETDLEMTWAINLYRGVEPTQARYRGHHATKAEFGREPSGNVYRAPSNERGAEDAIVDLSFGQDSALHPYGPAPGSWRWMSAWDPWAYDTGWYWQVGDPKAKAKGNIFGFFAGRASLAEGAGFSGPFLLTGPPIEGQASPRDPKAKPLPTAGVAVHSYRRTPANTIHPKSRFSWGLFIGTTRDLAAADQIQPIARQMNLHGGVNLNKLHRYTLDFPDPPGGYGGLYMDKSVVETMKAKLRADKEGPLGKGFYGYLYQADPPSRPLIDMWADPTGDKARGAAAEVLKTATNVLNRLVNGDGIYDSDTHFWHGGTAMMRHGVWIDQLLDENRLSEQERRQIKAAAVLFASVLWDNDFVPLDNHHGLNLGPANMQVQQRGYRNFYALLLARHPVIGRHAPEVAASAERWVKYSINEHGAEIGCPHYMSASFAPTLSTLLQVQRLGKEDPFQAEPRLKKFAGFYLNLLTPPEPRVGGRRCFISLGDSSTEASELYGCLATSFRPSDPALSANLMWAWQAGGKPHSSFFGTTLLMIDEAAPAADPKLRDAHFPGYYSVLRHGWATPSETAVWFVNGDHYSDHRHQDHGSVVVYALGQPLCLDWGSMYTPSAPGSFMHNVVTFESQIGHPWNQDPSSLNGGTTWSHSTPERFLTFKEGAHSRASFSHAGVKWTRGVTAIRADANCPLIVLHDSFDEVSAAASTALPTNNNSAATGLRAQSPKVFTLQLLATGDVVTPAGTVNPPLRIHPQTADNSQSKDPLPSTTSPLPLVPGVHRFGFTGKYDVDCDVYVLSDGPQEALIGNWCVTPWGLQITDKEESQHILRVRGSGTFTTLLVPRKRGVKRKPIAVTRENNRLIVKSNELTTTITPKDYEIIQSDATIRRLLD
jgi:hypothetical protein